MVTRRQQLLEMRAAETNRLKRALLPVRRRLERHIAFLTQEVEDLDQTIGPRLQASPLWREQEQLLKDVPGIGPVACMRKLLTILNAMLRDRTAWQPQGLGS